MGSQVSNYQTDNDSYITITTEIKDKDNDII